MVRFFIFCLFYMGLHTTSSSLCPEFCKCQYGMIFCTNGGLINIPQMNHLYLSTKHLSLAGNFIKIIGPPDFTFYTNLNILDLRFNSISNIPCGSFSYLNDLTELNLGNNHISSLDCQTFSGLTKLLSLDFHKDQLHDVQTGAFGGLGHLTKLRLSGNTLMTLKRGSFVGLQSLKALYLENNKIKALTRNTFKGLANLQELYLSGNNLSSFPIGVFKPLLALLELTLNNNCITQIKDTLLNPMVQLKTLSLNNNMISQIDSTTFKGLSKLEVLKLNENHILKIGKYTFRHCAQIMEIDLSDNSISKIEESAFGGLSNLKVLKLNHNKLLYLDPHVFDSSIQMPFLELNENLWDCSCRILWLKKWLESTINRIVIVFVRCSQPESLKGQYLDAISSALIQSIDSVCSDAELHVKSKTTDSRNDTQVTTQNTYDGENTHTQRRVGRTAPVLKIKNAQKRHILESKQYQDPPADVTMPRGYKTLTAIPARTTSTRTPQVKDITVSDACSYNQLVIHNISAVMVTSSSALIKWSLAKTDNQDVYFRVMFDHFNTRTRFSHFINVKQGTVCDLCDLRPSTPYFVCVESVVNERVCQVASRDLCLGIITLAEEFTSPEPQTIILYFSGINTVAIIGLLILFVYFGYSLRRNLRSDAGSLIYSQNRCVSCAVCAGIPMSDHNSGVNTSSSHTGTYQPNDIDAIDLPPCTLNKY